MNNLLYHVDAFTTEPYKGNPAGVMISSGELTEEYMQSLASELNLSETAFLSPQEGGFKIRFYTPETEVDLCGHASLSAAHILYETKLIEKEVEIHFFSNAGELLVVYNNGLIIMDFPAYKLKKVEIEKELEEATGLKALELYHCDYDWYLALLKDEKEVIEANPDFARLKLSKYSNLIVTALSGNENIDFVVRCFVPGMGINEDPVTGSAHCTLIPYWSGRLGKSDLRALQLSPRCGELFLEDRGDRVCIAGEAVLFLTGEIQI